MEIKKTDRADLERKKPIFFQIGLILSLSLILFSFEYISPDNTSSDDDKVVTKQEIEEVIMQTEQVAKPTPFPQLKTITNSLTIVDKNAIVYSVIKVSQGNASQNQEYQTIEQEPVIDAVETDIFTLIEEPPTFPGGEENRIIFFKENVKYPPVAREKNIEGIVYIQFFVEKDGSISNPTIVNDIGGGCGEEALRVVKNMPKWYPGKRRGNAIKSQFILPIKFILS